MAAGRDIRAGKAFVEIGGDDSKLVRALKRSGARVRAFGRNVSDLGRSMAMVGGAALVAFGAAAKIFASMGDNVAKMARRTGFGVEALSELSYAAQRSGTDLGSLENSLRRMQRTIYDAGRELSTAVDALADLGLGLADLQGLKPVEQFKLIAQRLSEVGDATTKAAIAMTIFGRSGTALLPMLEGGAAGIDELQKAARRLGLTISTEDSLAAEQFTDALGDMKLVIKHNAFAIGSALAPKMKQLAEYVTKVMTDVKKWISENQAFIVGIAKAAVKLTILAVGLIAVGKGCAILGAAMTLLATHPVIAILGVAAMAVMGLKTAMDLLTAQTDAAANAMRKLREAGDEQRQTATGQIKRLKELAGNEKLNSAEMVEAAGLIKALEDSYGSLGMVLDKTSGKVLGLATAQTKLNKTMREQALEQVLRESIEVENAIASITGEMQKLADTLGFHANEIDRLGKRRAVMMRRSAELEKRMVGIVAGEVPAILGGAPKAVAGPGAGAGGDPARRQKRLLDELQRICIAQIEDRDRREITALLDRYRLRIEKEREAGATIEAIQLIEQQREIELAGMKKRFDNERATERRRLNKEEWAEARRLAEGLFDASKVDSAVKRMSQARGTFYAAALGGLAAAGPMNQIAENTKVTAAEVKRMRQHMLALQAVWQP